MWEREREGGGEGEGGIRKGEDGTVGTAKDCNFRLLTWSTH